MIQLLQNSEESKNTLWVNLKLSLDFFLMLIFKTKKSYLKSEAIYHKLWMILKSCNVGTRKLSKVSEEVSEKSLLLK